jgi:hypothetical protein
MRREITAGATPSSAAAAVKLPRRGHGHKALDLPEAGHLYEKVRNASLETWR